MQKRELTNKIRILHLIDSRGMYGAETVVLTLLIELKKYPFQFILGCIKDPTDTQIQLANLAKAENIDVVYFTMRRGLSLRGLLRIIRFIKNNNIRIVHSHGYKPNILLALVPKIFLKVKIVATIHGWTKNLRSDKKLWFYEKLNCFAIKKFNKCVSVSNSVSRDLLNQRIPPRQIFTIHNGIDTKKALNLPDQSAIKRVFNVPDGSFIIGTAGRLFPEKGIGIFLEAASLLLRQRSDTFFLVAGDGPLLTDLLMKAKELGIDKNVLFLGFTDRIFEYLSILDIFVLSSLTEGLPMVLLEAMYAGCPVVCSRVGGIPEVIDDETSGFCIEPNNPQILSEKLLALLKDPSLGKRVARNARIKVKKSFSSDSMAVKYIELYNELLAKKE